MEAAQVPNREGRSCSETSLVLAGRHPAFEGRGEAPHLVLQDGGFKFWWASQFVEGTCTTSSVGQSWILDSVGGLGK